MKKAYIFLFLTAMLVSGTCLFLTSDKIKQNRFETFLKKELRKIPGQDSYEKENIFADEPDMAALQDYFMTFDPKTGKVPRERLLKAYQQTRKLMELKSGLTPLQWQGYEANMGGRTRAIMYDPNDPVHKKVWAGGITGGLWYIPDITSTSSSWVPVGDFWSDLSIRCITYDPLHPQVFYIGTGEAETAIQTYRESSGLGDGIWKSTDGGQTWNILTSTTGFAYVTDIHIRNESGISIIYAGVASGLYEYQQHQSLPSDGLFRSADGGTTWQQVLPDIPGHTIPYAVSDIAIGADGRIYVGSRPNLDGNGGAILLHSDLGTTGSWTVDTTYKFQIDTASLFNVPGRVVLAAAPSDPTVVYALIASGTINPDNGFLRYYCLYVLRSSDRGNTWVKKTIPPPPPTILDTNFAYIAWHALDITVDPNNANNVFAGGIDMNKSTNGGDSWSHISDWSLMYGGGGPQYIHADQHIILFKPGSSSEILFGSDGGVFYTSTGTQAQPYFDQRNKNYTTLQFYSCGIHPASGQQQFIGGLQDNGSLHYTGNPLTINDMIDGGDGAFCFYDQLNPNIYIVSHYYNAWSIYGIGPYGNGVSIFSGVFVNPADYDYKLKKLYANATDFLGNYTDQILRISNVDNYSAYGEFVPVHTGSTAYFSCVRYSPFSPVGQSTIFLGTQAGGLFKVTHAETAPTASEITGSNFPAGNISSIAIGGSEDTLLVTFSNYGVPSVWQTYDGGITWQDREGNLPDMPIRWAIYHPDNTNYAMLATETGTWTTSNINQTDVVWTPDITGMANVRVDMLNMRKSDNTVLAATHGRGLFTTIWDLPTGIKDLKSPQFSIYPNPTKGKVNLTINGHPKGSVNLSIYDQNGKILSYFSKALVTGENHETIDLSSLPKGIYYIGFEGNQEEKITKKVVLY